MMANCFTLNPADEMVKTLLSGLSDEQRQILNQCAASVAEPKSNEVQSLIQSEAKSMPLQKKANGQSSNVAKPSISKGKDINLMKQIMCGNGALPTNNSKEKQKEVEKPSKYEKKHSSGDRFGGNKVNGHKYDAMKEKKRYEKYDIVQQQMKENLKTSAMVEARKTKMEAQVKKGPEKPEKLKTTKIEVVIDDSQEEFEQWIVSLKTGLDSHLVPKRILRMNEYKGMIFHLVEWTDPNFAPEIIASKVLSARYPQVVIKYYESLSVKVNIKDCFERKTQKLDK